MKQVLERKSYSHIGQLQVFSLVHWVQYSKKAMMGCISTQIYKFSKVVNFCESQVLAQNNETQGAEAFCPFHQFTASARQMCSSKPLRLQQVTCQTLGGITSVPMWMAVILFHIIWRNLCRLVKVNKTVSSSSAVPDTQCRVQICSLSIFLKGIQNGAVKIKVPHLLKAGVKFV